MNAANFYKRLGFLTLTLAALLIGLNNTDWFEGTLAFSISSLVLFVLFTVFVFVLGIRSKDSPNKNQFTAVAFFAIFGKLILTLGILLTYNKVAKPESKMYVILFLLIYLVFTVFETGVMMKLAKSPEQNNKE